MPAFVAAPPGDARQAPRAIAGGGRSRHAPVARAMDYMLTRWEGFARIRDDGRVCLTNAAARALRGIALGRKAWLFADSDLLPTC